MYGMAQEGQAPKSFMKLTRNGVPWMTVLVMSVVLLLGVVLTILFQKKSSYLLPLSRHLATVWVWLMILLSQVAMRRQMSAEEAKN